MFYRVLPISVSEILVPGTPHSGGRSRHGERQASQPHSPQADPPAFENRSRYATPPAHLGGSGLCVRESAPAYEASEGPGDEPAPTCDESEPAVDVFAVSLQYADAATVHNALKSLFRVGRKVLLCSIDALRVMHDNVHWLEIGYTSFVAYCERELSLSRSTAYEYVRAAEALDLLPRVRALFGQGELSWDQVRAITRVATPQTEVNWIELAFDEPVGVLLEEVRQAGQEGRNSPHDRRYGLPNLMVKMTFRCTIEERERVLNAFAVVQHGLGLDLGAGPGDGPSPADDDRRAPLVRWADAVLSGELPVAPPVPEEGEHDDGEGGRANLPKRAAPTQTILYRTCPECRKSSLDTAQGPVAIPPERIEELEPASNHVVIDPEEEEPVAELPSGQSDKPNTARLTRQVLHRDGLKCANPDCDRTTDLQAHHIKFRSEGGPTCLSNEVAVCRICHAMIHQGLLEVTGSVDTGLTWTPCPANPEVEVHNAEQLHQLLKDLVAKVPTPPAPEGEAAFAGAPGPRGRPSPQSRYIESRRLADLVEALQALNFSKSESEDRIRWAVATLIREKSSEGAAEPEPLDDQEIINKAFRFGQPGF